jgi:hypothetical protein
VTAILGSILAAATAAVVLLLRGRPPAAAGAGLVGAILVLVAALVVRPDPIVVIGGLALAPTPYGGQLTTFMAGATVALALLALIAGRGASAIAAAAAATAASGIALAAIDHADAAWAVLAGSLAALLATVPDPSATATEARADGAWAASADRLIRALRAVAVGSGVVIVGIAAAAPTVGAAEPDAVIGGVVYLAVGVGLAIRAAGVPFHGWAARFADASHPGAVAAIVGWLPAVLVVVALAWSDATISPVAADVGWDRAVIVGLALATIALVPVAATLADDAAHGVVYLAIAGAGLAAVGFSAVDPAAWGPTRSWLGVLIVVVAGLAVWLWALEAAYGTRHLPELRGWARRSPGLGIGLAVLAVATVGLPGTLVWEARTGIVDAAIVGPVAILARLLVILPLVPIGRMLVTGLAAPSATVAAGRSDRPVAPGAGPDRIARVRAAADANRAPLATAVVLVVALLAVAVATGATGLGPAADGGPPGTATDLGPTPEP